MKIASIKKINKPQCRYDLHVDDRSCYFANDILIHNTDGQNLMLSYDVIDRSARSARNKGNIKSGGLTAAGLADKFGGRGALEFAFNDAFSAFESAVSKMSREEQEEIFGPNTNIYYNAEIQDPRTANVINYDVKTLTIHRVGHHEFDRETGKPTGKDVSGSARKLARALERVQGERESEKFRVEMNAIRRLKALSNDRALEHAIRELDSTITEAELSDTDTIADYMVVKMIRIIDSRVDISTEAKSELLKRIFKEPGANIRHVLKLIPKEDLETQESVRSIVRSSGQLLSIAIRPVEEVIHDFSVEMLKGLHSAFVVDNDAEVTRLRQEVSRAIQAIENSGSEEAMNILQRHMKKLKDVENVSTAAEGFVFDYDGVTYKFTGNFAPINQLLGLFKYGRGNVPPMRKLDEEDKDTNGHRIAIVPGAFKPPHRGHLEMVKHYTRISDEVVIMISPLARRGPSGREIGYDASKAVWQIYLRDAGLENKVRIIKSPVNSPVLATYEFVENKYNSPELAQPGDIIIPGCSTKGGDESRFRSNFEKYAREGVKIADAISCAYSAPDDAISAKDFRKALENEDILELEYFIPPSTDPREVLTILGVEPAQHNKLDSDIWEMSSIGAGSVSGFSGSSNAKEELIEEILNYLINKGICND
jgi:hypothetical protein